MNKTYIENISEQFVEWTVSNQKRGDAIINELYYTEQGRSQDVIQLVTFLRTL